ncbi:MAG: hypothetical protein KTR27_01860 [Leptolyngbyaceae cyanobacterium MAG.088]|nr:hypothetical protein [Leptolyngbyaceae cyanobacterium MAG.088]
MKATKQRLKWLRLGIVGLLGAIAAPFVIPPIAEAGQIIIITDPHHRYPVYERERVRSQVTVEFIAQGNEWANVYVDGRRILSAHNTNRRKRFTFREGAYELKITGVNYFDVWAEGYLDVGRDDTNIIVVSFSEQGVRVSGDPHAWIPIATDQRSSVR